MKQNGTNRKITFGAANTIRHHKWQMEQKVKEIQDALTGRSECMLPEDWTDEDAWRLAGDLAHLMVLAERAHEGTFDEEHPYPHEDTLLEDVQYSEKHDWENNLLFPEEKEAKKEDFQTKLERWKKVLHCGVLIAMGTPDFPFKGTFSDLEDLFLGVVRSGGDPVLKFNYVLDLTEYTLSEDNLRYLEEMDFGPAPPAFEDPKDPIEEALQTGICNSWEQWSWVNRHSGHAMELRKAIEEMRPPEDPDYPERSKYEKNRIMSFIRWEIGIKKLLEEAINLYLYQIGASCMTGDSYFVTYAMLCQTKKQVLAAIEAEERLP